MARFMALITLPEFSNATDATAYAQREFSRTLVRVVSTASWEIAEEERQRFGRKAAARQTAPNDEADGA